MSKNYTHEELVERARRILAEQQAEAEADDDYSPMDPQGIIETMIDELDEHEDIEPHIWLVEAIERAVKAACDEVRAR